MTSDAYWIKQVCGKNSTGGSGLSATLPDYARFGEFMLDGGKIDEHAIISNAWVEGGLRK